MEILALTLVHASLVRVDEWLTLSFVGHGRSAAQVHAPENIPRSSCTSVLTVCFSHNFQILLGLCPRGDDITIF